MTEYTDEELLDSIRDLADELGGRAPSIREHDSRGEAGTCTVRERFGTWSAGVEAAGLEPLGRDRVTRQECVRALRKMAGDLGRRPRAREASEFDYAPSHGTMVDRFGTWNAALEAAGIEPRPSFGHDEFVEALQDGAGTVPEVAGRVGCSRETAYDRLRSMDRAEVADDEVIPHLWRLVGGDDR